MRHRGTLFVTASVLAAAAAVALASAGGFDATFGVGGIVREPGLTSPAYAWTTAVQPDGKIVAAGTDAYDFRVRRYLADGSDDTAFGTSGSVSLFSYSGGTRPVCFDLAIDGAGGIVCVGTGALSATTPKATVVRLRSDGSLDTSFGTGGAVHVGDVLAAAAGTGARKATAIAFTGVALQPDGRILVSGRVSLEVGKRSSPTLQYAILLARLLANGALDTSFGIGGLVVHDRTSGDDMVCLDAVGVQSDGKVVVGSTLASGTTSNVTAGKCWVITRYFHTGAVDTAFGAVLGAGRVLLGLTVDGSDRILASGKLVYSLNVSNDAVVERYLPGGTPDPAFGTGGSCVFGANARDEAMSSPVVLADGRIVLALHSYPAALGVPHAVRLTSAGTLDGTFGVGGISDPLTVGDLSNIGRSVAIAQDGGVILAGRAVFENGAALNTFEWILAKYQGN